MDPDGGGKHMEPEFPDGRAIKNKKIKNHALCCSKKFFIVM